MSDKQPTSRQLAYLGALALRTGQTFTTPATRAQASSEIGRLKRQPTLTTAELDTERTGDDRDQLDFRE